MVEVINKPNPPTKQYDPWGTETSPGQYSGGTTPTEVGLSPEQTAGTVAGQYVERPQDVPAKGVYIVKPLPTPYKNNFSHFSILTPEEALVLGRQPAGEPAIGSQLYYKTRHLQSPTARWKTEKEIQQKVEEVAPYMTKDTTFTGRLVDTGSDFDFPRAGGGLPQRKPVLESPFGKRQYPYTPIDYSRTDISELYSYPLYKGAAVVSRGLTSGLEWGVERMPLLQPLKEVGKGFGGMFTGLPEYFASGVSGIELAAREPMMFKSKIVPAVKSFGGTVFEQAKERPFYTAGQAAGIVAMARGIGGKTTKIQGIEKLSIEPKGLAVTEKFQVPSILNRIIRGGTKDVLQSRVSKEPFELPSSLVYKQYAESIADISQLKRFEPLPQSTIELYRPTFERTNIGITKTIAEIPTYTPKFMQWKESLPASKISPYTPEFVKWREALPKSNIPTYEVRLEPTYNIGITRQIEPISTYTPRFMRWKEPLPASRIKPYKVMSEPVTNIGITKTMVEIPTYTPKFMRWGEPLPASRIKPYTLVEEPLSNIGITRQIEPIPQYTPFWQRLNVDILPASKIKPYKVMTEPIFNIGITKTIEPISTYTPRFMRWKEPLPASKISPYIKRIEIPTYKSYGKKITTNEIRIIGEKDIIKSEIDYSVLKPRDIYPYGEAYASKITYPKPIPKFELIGKHIKHERFGEKPISPTEYFSPITRQRFIQERDIFESQKIFGGRYRKGEVDPWAGKPTMRQSAEVRGEILKRMIKQPKIKEVSIAGEVELKYGRQSLIAKLEEPKTVQKQIQVQKNALRLITIPKMKALVKTLPVATTKQKAMDIAVQKILQRREFKPISITRTTIPQISRSIVESRPVSMFVQKTPLRQVSESATTLKAIQRSLAIEVPVITVKKIQRSKLEIVTPLKIKRKRFKGFGKYPEIARVASVKQIWKGFRI